MTNLSSSSGAVSAAYDYDAFGQTTPSWQPGQNPYRFSTKEWLGYANLYYFGARYYDPEVGRWLTPDPLGYVDGLNLYVYVNNNPINFVDPYGLMGERFTEEDCLTLLEVDIHICRTTVHPSEQLQCMKEAHDRFEACKSNAIPLQTSSPPSNPTGTNPIGTNPTGTNPIIPSPPMSLLPAVGVSNNDSRLNNSNQWELISKKEKGGSNLYGFSKIARNYKRSSKGLRLCEGI